MRWIARATAVSVSTDSTVQQQTTQQYLCRTEEGDLSSKNFAKFHFNAKNMKNSNLTDSYERLMKPTYETYRFKFQTSNFITQTFPLWCPEGRTRRGKRFRLAAPSALNDPAGGERDHGCPKLQVGAAAQRLLSVFKLETAEWCLIQTWSGTVNHLWASDQNAHSW